MGEVSIEIYSIIINYIQICPPSLHTLLFFADIQIITQFVLLAMYILNLLLNPLGEFFFDVEMDWKDLFVMILVLIIYMYQEEFFFR